MKKCIVSAFLLLAMITVIGISCKSAPPPEPAPASEPGSAPEPQVSADPSKAKARMEEARQRAIDFECPAYFPSEWELAETRYDAVNFAPQNQLTETVYNTAADEYEALLKKTAALYAQAREDEITAVRDELIATGLTPSFPEYLQSVDETALAALDQYEAGDYYSARDTAAKALSEYETLLAGAKVYLIRQEIVDRGFDMYDAENFDKADEYGETALDEYEAGNNKAAVDNAEEAGLRYSMVLSTGWLNYVADQWTFAAAERDLAMSQKVNIASRDIYREAETVYGEAEEALKAEDYEAAAVLFTEANALFLLGIQDTETKRQRAQGMIRLAEEMIEESDEAAMEAERLIEGGSR